jgi:hypothetical protein
MNELLFVGSLGTILALTLRWAFVALPRDGWQVAVAVPLRRDPDGLWSGANLTFYGAWSATAVVGGAALFVVCLASIGTAAPGALALVGTMYGVGMLASSLVARFVERRRSGFSVAGAAFVGFLALPLATRLLRPAGMTAPLLPVLAAAGTAYLLAEAVGRLACISFGCCYGKPLEAYRGRLRRLLEHFPVEFHGATKKIAFESGMEGVKVVPIQAATSTVYVLLGIAGLWLFLQGFFRAALIATLVPGQLWRIASEFHRADYRGEDRWTPYQTMAGSVAAGALALGLILPDASGAPHLGVGLRALWDPTTILVLEALWLVTFIRRGWSSVTGARLSFFVQRDRI